MITEKRLRELIEQKATIYFAIQGYIEKVELIPQNEEFYLKINNDCLMFITDNPYVYDDEEEFYDLEELFETKEEAEWQSEFGNITRTETLKLPTWEEIEKDLYGRTGSFYIVDNDCFSLVYDKGEIISQILLRTVEENYNWNADKGNYIKACQIAKKLFLGEE